MDNFIISINPPHSRAIVNLRKTIEWRKHPLPRGYYLLYETKKNNGCGKIIGIFLCEGDYQVFGPLDYIFPDVLEKGCVGKDFIKAYAKEKPVYANEIKGAVKFTLPIELSELNIKRPPQSYCRCDIPSWSIFHKHL